MPDENYSIAELNEALTAANAELVILNAVQAALVNNRDMQGIYNAVGDKLTEIFNSQTVAIYSADWKSGVMHVNYVFEKGKKLPPIDTLINSLYRYVLDLDDTFVMNGDFPDFAAKFKDYKVPQGEMPKSILVTPVIRKRESDQVVLIGLMDIDSGRQFLDSDIRLVETVACAMGLALKNARLFEDNQQLLAETEERNAELAVINSVQEGLASKLDMAGIYNLIGDKIYEITGAGVVLIAAWDWDTSTMRAEYFQDQGEKFDASERPLSALHEVVFPELEQGKTIVWNDGIEERYRQFGHVVAAGKIPKTSVAVPLRIVGKIKASIMLQDTEKEYAFSESTIRLVETLADSMEIALENAILFEETQRLFKAEQERVAELAIINSVQQGLASKLDMQAIYDLVGDRISEITGSEIVVINTWNSETETIRFEYIREKGQREEFIERPFTPLNKFIIPDLESGKTIVWNTNVEERIKKFGHTLPAGEMPRSVVTVPLRIGQLFNASISLQNISHEYAFSESDVRLLETLASSMSVALENARLFDKTQHLLKETESRNAELAIINSVQEGLVAQIDMQSIFDLVGDKIQDIFGAFSVLIALFSPDGQTNTPKYVIEGGKRFYPESSQLEPGGIGSTIIQTQKPIMLLKAEDWEPFGFTIIPGTENTLSAIYVPMIVADQVKGAVSIQALPENAFNSGDLRLLTTLTNSMSIALENARLFEETQRLLNETESRNAELAVINSVQQGMVSELNFQSIIDLVGDELRKILKTDNIGIRIIDHENQMVMFPYEFEKGRRLNLQPSPLANAPLTANIFQNKRSVRGSSAKFTEELGLTLIPGTEMSKSFLAVPILVGDEVRGVVNTEDYVREDAFTESDQRLLETLAYSMGVALENARLFDETQRLLTETEQRAQELEIINSVGKAMSRQLDVKTITRTVGDKVTEIFKADASSILMLDATKKMIHPAYEWDEGKYIENVEDFPLGQGLTSTVIQTRKPLLLGTAEEAAASGAYYPPEAAEINPRVTQSYLGVPIIVGENVIGVVSVHTYSKHAYSQESVRLLSTLANNLGVALENARLFDETERLLQETEERNAELAVITSVQQGLASKLDIQSIYDLVGEKIQETFNAQVVVLRSYDLEKQMEIEHYVVEKGIRGEVPPYPLADLGQYLIRHKQSIVINSDFSGRVKELTGEEVFLPAGEMPRSAIFVPLFRDQEVCGSISLQNIDYEEVFSDSDVRLLQTLANSMSVALENARLFDETQRLLKITEERNSELAIINTIGQTLTQELDLQSLIDLVGEKIRAAVNTENIGIGLYDKETNLLSSMYVYKNGERVHPEPAPFNAFNLRFAKQGKSLVLNDVSIKMWKKLGSNLTFGNEIPKSVIMVPILTSGELIGGITLQNFEKENAYPESMVRLLETIASNMGTAIQNARLFESERQRAAELSVISKVSQALVAEPELDNMIQLIGNQAMAIFNADIAFVALLNPQTGFIDFPYQFGDDFEPLPLGQGLTSTIISSGEPLLFNSDIDQRSSALGVSRIGRRAQSFLGVPIKSGRETIGVLSVQNTTTEDIFDDNDLRLLTTIAANAGAAIHTAQLHAETQHRAREMATLAEIGNDIASTHDLDSTLMKIAERAKGLLKVGDIALYLMDETGEKIIPRVVLGEYVDQIMAMPISVGRGISGMVVKTGVAELVNDPSKHPNTVTILGTPEFEEEPEGLMSAPLISGGKVIGLINVWRKHSVGLFSQAELDFLISVARQTAIAIDSARLYLETEHYAEQMFTLESVGREISSDLDLQSVLERIGERALTLLQGRSAAIRLLDGEGNLIPVVALGEYADRYMEHIIQLGNGITGDVAQSGKAEIINNPLEDARLVLVPGTREVDTEALIICPLTIADSVIGTLSIWRDKSVHGRFSDSDLGFALGLARQAAIAITNANLFKEVERQKEYLEALISSAPVAIITIGLDGLVTSWSPAAENLFGYNSEEAIGQNIDDLVANDDEIREEAELHTNKFLVDIGKMQLKSRRSHKDGHLIDVAINAMPVNIEGELNGYIAIYNDISELEKARRDAEEANYAKSAFLANMSHELRTPLNAIIGFTRIVKRKGENVLPDKQLENLEKVLVSAEHLLGLINTVLDISKIEAGRMEVYVSRFDLKSMVDLVAVTTQPLVRQEAVELLTEIPEDIPMINSDIEKIKQILINLVSNAAKFTHKGEIKVKVSSVNGQIEIDVVDTGIGISPKAIEHIFEEFQQADSSTTREYGGTGLGLSISRSLAKLLGGDLRVVSEVGVGSTFTFSFPATYGQTGDVSQTQTFQAQPNENNPLVLVIDDNEDAICLVGEILEGAGYQVAVARNGVEGLSMAAELMPFVITLDIMMPEKDGWEVLHDLKANPATKPIPVILISIVDQKAMGFRLGAEDYLVKPLREGDLLQSLAKIKLNHGNKNMKRLLVVDDDPNVVEMIRQLLEGKQYQIEAATDGIDALEWIKANKPDAVLLDLMTPRLDGFGLIEQIRQIPEFEGLPIIVLTAKLLTDQEKEALKQSVGQVIQKQGISGEELLGEISETIKKTIL